MYSVGEAPGKSLETPSVQSADYFAQKNSAG